MRRGSSPIPALQQGWNLADVLTRCSGFLQGESKEARESTYFTSMIRWEETAVVDQARTPKELLLKEAIHIRLLKPLPLNRDGGLERPGC